MDAAIAELARRHVVRETADGQAYVASPAEYLVTLDQLPYAGCLIDPMGTRLACASRRILRRAVSEDVTRALRMPHGTSACAIQSSWEAGGVIAALSTTYVPGYLADMLAPPLDGDTGPAPDLIPGPLAAATPAAPGALRLEVQPPPRWAARALRLRYAQSAIIITIRLDDPSSGSPLALTTAILHPARFRVTVKAPDTTPGNPPGTGKAAPFLHGQRQPGPLPSGYPEPGGAAATAPPACGAAPPGSHPRTSTACAWT